MLDKVVVGIEGNGGNGGGVNVDGTPGSGLNPGFGGERPVSGTLDLNGVYGSVLTGSSVQLYDGDEIEDQQRGGRTVSCTKGSFYINQGFSPCEDVSDNLYPFVDGFGNTYDESSILFRGFKSWIHHYRYGVVADDVSGVGGNGASGGDGGSNKSGGGGGSGYIDDSVVVVSTTVGGNKDQVSEITFSV